VAEHPLQTLKIWWKFLDQSFC